MVRPLNEQVIVITGASSGIGRETALRAAKKGATVVLVARNQVALNQVELEILNEGGKAQAMVADVTIPAEMEQVVREAVARFGHIDTWVNNASISMYATFDNTSIEEFEQILRINVLGVVNGTKAVLPVMKTQRQGTIINIGSVLSQRGVPLQSAYVAAKHAIKGFTETLRLELMHDKSGINVTLIMPASINTPFFNHARSKMGVKPQPVPPVYTPGLVADAILIAAQHPRRDIIVGSFAQMLVFMEKFMPAFLDGFMIQNSRMYKQQQTDQPDDGLDNMFAPIAEPGRVQGDFGHLTLPIDPPTRLEMRPNLKSALLAGLMTAGYLFLRRNTLSR
jgi:short-subunit dehydrogenase